MKKCDFKANMIFHLAMEEELNSFLKPEKVINKIINHENKQTHNLTQWYRHT